MDKYLKELRGEAAAKYGEVRPCTRGGKLLHWEECMMQYDNKVCFFFNILVNGQWTTKMLVKEIKE